MCCRSFRCQGTAEFLSGTMPGFLLFCETLHLWLSGCCLLLFMFEISSSMPEVGMTQGMLPAYQNVLSYIHLLLPSLHIVECMHLLSVFVSIGKVHSWWPGLCKWLM